MQKNNDNAAKWKSLLQEIQKKLGSPPDLILRSVRLKDGTTVQCMYLESLADRGVVDNYIMKSLRVDTYEEVEPSPDLGTHLIQDIELSAVHPNQLQRQIADALLSGQCVVSDSNGERIQLIQVFGTEHRQVEEPKSEHTVRGPHEGFTEDIRINMGLIRKRIRNPHLRFEQMKIGDQTQTTVMMAYIDQTAPEPLVQEVRRRLLAIRAESVLDSAYIEEYIQDRKWSPFPTLSNTEKPDMVSSQLLDGKVAIMVDGTANVLYAPMVFFEFFSSPEDNYERADIATFIRWLRFLSFLIAVFVPSIFVAVTTFHQELLPTQLLINLSGQTEGAPLPTLAEVFLMEIMFEIIREGGLRMPRAIGQALSIVGAIVLGQSAVEAGLISASVVIVVSVTGIANFVVPTYSFGMSQRLIRFTFIFLAGFMGLVGILCGLLFLMAHLVSIKSFGIPYLSPVVPAHFADWKEIFARLPRPYINRRPRYLEKLKMKK